MKTNLKMVMQTESAILDDQHDGVFGTNLHEDIAPRKSISAYMSLNWRHINNPGYNADRGSDNIASMRLF